ncbi:hypothetical protein Taro_021708, partial [Colocasia esculenta]|nr:hypothetical protein [Colocasia esculenta]
LLLQIMMDIRTLYESISQFSLLLSNNLVKSGIVQRYCQKVDEILNPLKPVLDETIVSEVRLDEELNTVVEELDALINDTRKIIESLQNMSSKLYFTSPPRWRCNKASWCTAGTVTGRLQWRTGPNQLGPVHCPLLLYPSPRRAERRQGKERRGRVAGGSAAGGGGWRGRSRRRLPELRCSRRLPAREPGDGGRREGELEGTPAAWESPARGRGEVETPVRRRGVLHIESVVIKIRTYVFQTYQLLRPIFESLPTNSHFARIEMCTEKLQNMVFDPISDSIKAAMRDQIENIVPSSEHLLKIADSLSLSSHQELLMEAAALDLLKTKVNYGEIHGELKYIDSLIALINYLQDCHIRVKQLHSINGVPIPADLCCPLSLELMSDPVIVASGQTYERAFIRKWLDQGYTVCPKTRQRLGHTNLIPNYTVKALIVSWCESNNIKLPDPAKMMSLKKHSSASPSDSDPSSDISDVPTFGHHCDVHPRSPESSRSVCTGSASHIANAVEVNIASIKIASFDGKESSSRAQHSGFSDQVSDQPESESLHNDERLQRCNGTASASSAVSCTEYLQGTGDANRDSEVLSDLPHYSSDTSGEMAQESPVSSAPLKDPEFQSRLPEPQSITQPIRWRPSELFVPRIISPSTEKKPDISAVETQVQKLIEDLKSDSLDLQRSATLELRLLAKQNMENRIIIATRGAISHLVRLLHSRDPTTQEHAVTALLNLSINDNNKTEIANAGAIDPLIHVLGTGSPEARENSAATLYSLSVIEENKTKIGRSGAIKQLVELLRDGTPYGKRDAATALYNLSISHENKARIVQAGAVRHLVELMDPAAGMVDKAVSVLANLARIPEGRTAIGKEGGIPFLVEVVELGSAKGKEHAAAALLCLCTSSNKFCNLVLEEGAVPPLVALSLSGTARAKEKMLERNLTNLYDPTERCFVSYEELHTYDALCFVEL